MYGRHHHKDGDCEKFGGRCIRSTATDLAGSLNPKQELSVYTVSEAAVGVAVRSCGSVCNNHPVSRKYVCVCVFGVRGLKFFFGTSLTRRSLSMC